jgi:hypothetical protein
MLDGSHLECFFGVANVDRPVAEVYVELRRRTAVE